MEHVKGLLNKRLKQSGLYQNINTAMIINEFENLAKEIWGKAALNKIKPIYIKDKVLVIACLSSVMSQEIALKKNKIISQINKKFGPETIANLKFTL